MCVLSYKYVIPLKKKKMTQSRAELSVQKLAEKWAQGLYYTPRG
jgi:hypothetical protein